MASGEWGRSGALTVVVYQVPGALKVARISSAGREKAGGRAELQLFFFNDGNSLYAFFLFIFIWSCLYLSFIISRITLRGSIPCVIDVICAPSTCCLVRRTRWVRAGYRRGEAVVGKVSDEVACNGSRQRKTRRRGNGAGFFARFSLSWHCSLRTISSKGSSAVRSRERLGMYCFVSPPVGPAVPGTQRVVLVPAADITVVLPVVCLISRSVLAPLAPYAPQP